jgi:hypothetical protein
VVADTVVADTVVGAVSDAAWPVFPAVAGPALPEPYVPGSGDRVPAELRLVLAGYVGIACGLFAGGLACAAAAVFLAVNDLDVGLLSLLLPTVCISGFLLAFEPLMTRSGFSRLLRRPSDPRTATVTASKLGGSTLILDIPRDGTGRRYQSLSEVRLALWLKAACWCPGDGERLWGSGGRRLLISSPTGPGILGTVKSHRPQPNCSTKVSSVILVDWAAWAASTLFSSTDEG